MIILYDKYKSLDLINLFQEIESTSSMQNKDYTEKKLSSTQLI